jgi:hypothetical protein
MTLAEFTASLKKAKPPACLPAALAALWWAGKDKWEEAHQIVMNEGKDCAWVHAHLHRAEGDLDNARYWYRQAKRSLPASSLPEEWNDIARTLLAAA